MLVLKRAAFVNLLIHLTPITRLLPTHPLASHRLLSCHRSKRCLGKLYFITTFPVHHLGTYAIFDFVIPFRAKPRPSKKARLDKAAEEDAIPEPGKTPDLEAAIPEDIPNDPPR